MRLDRRITFLSWLSIVWQLCLPPVTEQAAKCCKAVPHAMRRLALGLHREAQRTQDDALFALADRAYQLFLARFADDEDAYEVKFFWAERLWTLGRWTEAAEQYTRVVEARPAGQYARESARAAMLAWKNVQSSDDDPSCQGPRGHRAADCGAIAAEPIPEVQQKFVGAIHTYAKMVPDTPDMPVMLYRAACIYYDHGHLDRAEALFLEVVEKHTKHELASASASLYIDALSKECKTSEILAAVRRFIDMPGIIREAACATPLLKRRPI